MACIADPILRVVLFVFSVISLGLVGAWVKDTDSPRVEFAVFAAAFSVVTVFYGLAAAFFEFLCFPVVTCIVDFMNWVFLFTGATCIAAKIECHDCSKQWYYDKFFDGSKRNCRLAQAGCAFEYFSWFVAVVLFVYSLLAVLRGPGRLGLPSRKRSVPRTGVPTMSQV